MRPAQLLILVWLAYLFGPVRVTSPENAPGERIAEALLSGKQASGVWDARTPVAPGEAGHVQPRLAILHGLFQLPFAAAVRSVYPHRDPDERARLAGRVAGSFFAAAAVALTFAVLTRLVDTSLALILALGAAFASPLYGTASRSGGSVAPAALAVASFLWLLQGQALWRDAARGAITAGLYLLQPGSVFAPIVLLTSLRNGSPTTGSGPVRALAFGAAAATALVLLMSDAITGEHTWALPSLQAFAAYLVSPARSLLLFAPLSILAAAALFSRGHAGNPILRGAGLALLVGIAEVSCLRRWWVGSGFGPSHLTGYVPLLATMAAFAPQRLIRWSPLFLLPVAALYTAQVFRGGHVWDERRQIEAHPEAIWDFRDSPISDVVFGAPKPDPARLDPAALLLTPGEHSTGVAPLGAVGENQWFVYGWEVPERNGIWAEGSESWLAFSLPGRGDYTLTLTAAAPSLRGRTQALTFEWPGRSASPHEFTRGLWNFESVRLDLPYRPGVIVVRIRPRHIWLPGSGDVRRCSVFVKSLRLERNGEAISTEPSQAPAARPSPTPPAPSRVER